MNVNLNVAGHRSEDPNALLDEQAEDRSFEVHAGNVEELRAQVDKANRRLEKNDIAGRFTLRKLGERIEDNEDGTVDVFHVFELDRPELAAIAGWKFLAAVELLEGGTFLRVAEGQQMPAGYVRPDAHECQHCGVKRFRNRSFILRNEETGEVRQVGSTCLTAFLGIEVKGLWLLTAFTAEELADLREADVEHSGGGYVEQTFSVRFVIALAYVISNAGRKFVSRRVAIEQERQATADEVLEHINYRRFGSSQAELAHEAQVRADMEAAQALPAETVDAVIASASTLKDSDYADNLRAVLASEYINRIALGTLVSLLSVYRRGIQAEAEAKVNKVEKVNQVLGEVKTRLRGLELTVLDMREFEGHFGTTTLLIMEDAEGRSVKWFASATFSFEPGVQLVLDGTVKEHSEWRGQKQTVLTRCSIKKVIGND